MTRFGSPGAAWAALAAATACAIFLVTQKLIPSDDAYITFRHARNLMDSLRPAWNIHGPPVLGSTCPAFVFLLAGFCKALGLAQVDNAALYLNAVFHFIIVVLTYLVGYELLGRALPSLLLAILVGINGVAVYIFSQGFETAMLTAFLLGSLYCVRQKHDYLALVLASLAPLVRPEGILAAVLVWAVLAWERRLSWQRLLVFSIVPAGWTIWATAYYGSPVPHSIVAKMQFSAIYFPYVDTPLDLVDRLRGTPRGVAALWRHPARSLVTDGWAAPEFETLGQLATRWIVLLMIPLALISLIRKRDGVVYFLYPPLFLLLYGFVGHTQPWYFPSFVVFSIIALFCGLIRFVDLVTSWMGRPAKGTALAYLAAFVVFLNANDYKINRGEFDYSHRGFLFPVNPWGVLWDLWEIQRFTHYRTAAEYLNSNANPGDRVLTSEVGVLGYYYRGEVIDSVGLCSPEALGFYPPPEWDIRDGAGNYYTRMNNFLPTLMVQSLKPEYIVNSQAYLFNLLQDGSSFPEEYEEVLRYGRIWGEPVLIFRRK